MRFTVRPRNSVIAFLTTAMVVLAGGQPARAVTPVEVVSAIKTAYDAYQKFFGNQLTLESATATIINAINSAKTEIEAHIDQVTVATVQACARSAVTDLADIRSLTPDNVQAFARDATSCADLATAQLSAVNPGAAVDQLGFALNTVGPIALLARAYAGLTTSILRSGLTAGNNTVISRLEPSCSATPLWGDADPGPGAVLVEVQLNCWGYNRVGNDWTTIRARRGQPLPPFDYTAARNDAMQFTSYPVARAALPELAM